jgi:Icc protein
MHQPAVPSNDTIKIIQITDTHTFADDESEMLGVKSNKKLDEVIQRMIAEDGRDVDLIFLTGDLSQDETHQSYEKITEHLRKLSTPIYWIPGNHDNIAHMETVFNKTDNFFRSRRLSTHNWDFIFLNTKEQGAIDGFLDDAELTALEKEILATPAHKHVALIMHHHPAEVNTPLIDQYILRNRKPFWDLLADSPVKLIVCGHVHGDYHVQHNGIHIETSPSTCLQWAKGTVEMKTDERIGYKIYQFSEQSYTSLAKLW